MNDEQHTETTGEADSGNASGSLQEGTVNCLEHHFLVAMPQLNDPNFNGTVTYLWKHDSNGAIGIVINQPADLSLSRLLEELDIDISAFALSRLDEEAVVSGGPVERNKGFILHDAGTEWEYTIPVNDDISISMSKDILQAIAEGDGPRRYRVALGCAGWDAGQLEQEIADNAWLTVPANSELLFSSDFDGMAAAAAGILGVSLSQLSSMAGHS
jgi:putative transcriptional regulator